MITGDKQETAINIAVSCKLFTNTDSLLKCNANKQHAMSKVEQVRFTGLRQYLPCSHRLTFIEQKAASRCVSAFALLALPKYTNGLETERVISEEGERNTTLDVQLLSVGHITSLP